MEALQLDVFAWVYIMWAATTVFLVVLLSFRATLSTEDDQISTAEAKRDHYNSQQTFIVRRARLMGEIIVLSVISGGLLLACLGFSIYRGINNF
jgi:hypothetical protein